MASSYVPDAGDIVWIDFDPQQGHEQAGHRPAVILSPATYNGRTGLIVRCPTTTRIKGYPFEVALSGAAEERCFGGSSEKLRLASAACHTQGTYDISGTAGDPQETARVDRLTATTAG